MPTDAPAPTPRPADRCRRPVGLVAALLAVAIAAAAAWGRERYALRRAARYVAAAAGMDVPVKYRGLAFQRAALADPRVLPIYGSSELFCCGNPFLPSEVFASAPSGFVPFAVGRYGGTGDLFFMETFAALGHDLAGRALVLSDSPPWFMHREGANPAGYTAVFSPEIAYTFVFDAPISARLRRAGARRMLDYPQTLREEPLLRAAVLSLARPTPLRHAQSSPSRARAARRAAPRRARLARARRPRDAPRRAPRHDESLRLSRHDLPHHPHPAARRGCARPLPGRPDEPRRPAVSLSRGVGSGDDALARVEGLAAGARRASRARGEAPRLDHAAARVLRRLHAARRAGACGVLRPLRAHGDAGPRAVARLPRPRRRSVLLDRRRFALEPARLGVRRPCARHVLARGADRSHPGRPRGARPRDAGPRAPGDGGGRDRSRMTLNDTGRRVLEILGEVTGDLGVLGDPDLPLYDAGLLDSLAVVTLIVRFEEAFGLSISPAELDKQAWSTPRALVADIAQRLAAG